jgi:hypothetical protein
VDIGEVKFIAETVLDALSTIGDVVVRCKSGMPLISHPASRTNLTSSSLLGEACRLADTARLARCSTSKAHCHEYFWPDPSTLVEKQSCPPICQVSLQLDLSFNHADQTGSPVTF